MSVYKPKIKKNPEWLFSITFKAKRYAPSENPFVIDISGDIICEDIMNSMLYMSFVPPKKNLDNNNTNRLFGLEIHNLIIL